MATVQCVGVAALYNIYIYFFFSYSAAVVAQAYKVDVEVLSAARGCTAILRCVVPTFVKELVRVVSWVHEPAIYIYPSLQGGKLTLSSFCQKPKGNATMRSSAQLSSVQSASASLSVRQANKVHCLFAVFASHVCLLNCHLRPHLPLSFQSPFGPLVHN